MKAIAFLATSDPAASRRFFEEILNLDFQEDSPFALVFDAGGVMLRIQKVEQVTVVPYTALGFEVADIDVAVQALQQRGVQFEQFAGMEQDELGIWTTPDGARIAWFRDPDNNLLSYSQMPE